MNKRDLPATKTKNLPAALRLFGKNFVGTELQKQVRAEMKKGTYWYPTGKAGYFVHGLFGETCRLMKVELGSTFYKVIEAEVERLCR